jgi:hypothetical protein
VIQPTIDVPRLRKELEYVTIHPERWNQHQWIQQTACGTVGCLAGNTVLHAGAQPLFGYNNSDHDDQASFVEIERGDDRHRTSVSRAARELLGLTDDQAEDLFHPLNSLHRLWSLAARFTDGEIKVPSGVEPEGDVIVWD